jgi:hypothetical protein
MVNRFKALLDACKAAKLSLRYISSLFDQEREPGFSASSLSKAGAAKGGNELKIKRVISKLQAFSHTVEDCGDYFVVNGKTSKLAVRQSSETLIHRGKKIEDLLKDHIDEGKTKLCVLDSWVNQNDFFITWLEEGLLAAVEVLVLDPSGEVLPARLRGRDPEAPYTDMSSYVKYLEKIWNCKTKFETGAVKGKHIEIRLFDEIPGMNIFMTEKVIFCAPHLMDKDSGNTFFIEIPIKGKDGEAAKELQDHYSKIWKGSRRSMQLTEGYLSELKSSFAYEGLYDTLAKDYVFYVLDESLSHPYQTSHLKIDSGRKSCTLYYEDRNNQGQIIEVEGKISFLPVRSHLMLSFRKGGFFLEAIGYFNQIKFIQVIYLHTDTNSKPRISCGVMMKASGATVFASRDYRDVPSEIRAYLYQFSKAPQINNAASNIKELKDFPPNYSFAQQYIGKWKLHYNVRLSREEKYHPKPFVGDIAQSILNIYCDEVHGNLCCEMQAHDGKKYVGNLGYDSSIVNSTTILGITLTLIGHEPDSLPVNFLFSVSHQDNVEKDRLQGTYNIVYANGMQGCGLAYMERIGESEDVAPGLITSPFFKKEVNDTASQLMSLLFFKRTAIVLPDDRKKYWDNINRLPHGVYRVYNHGVNRRADDGREKKAVIECVMEILPSGIVRFKGLNRSEAIGYAYLHERNVHIELRSMTHKRIGYFIIHTGGRDRNNEKDTLFGGVFLGTTVYSDFPIGKRVLLKKEAQAPFESLEPVKKTFPIDDQANISEAVQGTLAGASRNITGFLKPGSSIFREEDLNQEVQYIKKIGANFFEAACYKTILALKDVHSVGRGRIAEITNLLSRAARYGMVNVVPLFEAAIRDHDATSGEMIIVKFRQDEAYQYLERLEGV